MKNPFVSILIPVYNVSSFIVRCLESVSSQTYDGDLECILVDDCGSDNSIELAETFIKSYQGKICFRIVRHDHNRGLAAARNTAVANAKGDFVFHLDSDDWIESAAIERLVLLQLETDADIVSGHALQHENRKNSELKEPLYKSPMDMVYKTMEITLDHVIWRRLIRRSLYIENGIMAVEGINVGEDHHTVPRLAYYAKKIATLNEVVYHYNCLNPNSYMTKVPNVFNMYRYNSNLASIDVLQQFFSGKNDLCVRKLIQIKSNYFYNSMWNAAIVGDRDAYNQIVKDAKVEPHNSFYWMKAYLFGKRKKLKEIVKSILHK